MIGAEESLMPTSAVQHKRVPVDPGKLDRARTILGAQSDTEALNRALDIVVAEAEIDSALQKVRGRGKLRKIFR
jgi:hypothetical protein